MSTFLLPSLEKSKLGKCSFLPPFFFFFSWKTSYFLFFTSAKCCIQCLLNGTSAVIQPFGHKLHQFSRGSFFFLTGCVDHSISRNNVKLLYNNELFLLLPCEIIVYDYLIP